MRFLFAFLFLCLTATAHANPIDTQEVDRRIQKLMQRPDMVGLSIAVVENGNLTFTKGYGEVVKGSREAVTPDTVFRWASVSKGVAAATILNLAEDGHFGLGSPVGAHAPSLQLAPSRHVVTVEDILTHRTGLVRNAYDQRIEDGQHPKNVRSALKYLRRVCEPGECHTYQNVAFDAAAEMVETVTGMPYKAVVAEHIFKPLGMNSASLTLEGLVRSKSWARPHNSQGQTIPRIKGGYYRIPAAAGVNSSIIDMSLWMQAQMPASHNHLPRQIQNALQVPRVNTPRESRILRRNFHALRNAQYGLGWRIYDYEGHRVIGHRGAVDGYRALMLFDPVKQTGVAIMWNSPSAHPIGLQLEIMDQLYGRPRRDWMRLG